jgi:hypothetical protein
VRRPYLPETPQDNYRDSATTGRVGGLGSKQRIGITNVPKDAVRK